MHVPKVHIVSKWSSWLILVGMAIKSKQLKAFHTIGDSLSTPSFFCSLLVLVPVPWKFLSI